MDPMGHDDSYYSIVVYCHYLKILMMMMMMMMVMMVMVMTIIMFIHDDIHNIHIFITS